MADAQSVASAFVTYYYSTFDSNRAGLTPLYRDISSLSFEGQEFKGAANITEKLVSLPFQRVEHAVSTVDAQFSDPQNTNIIVVVTGKLLIDEERNPQQFSQAFQLISENGSYWVYNDVFRLNYG